VQAVVALQLETCRGERQPTLGSRPENGTYLGEITSLGRIDGYSCVKIVWYESDSFCICNAALGDAMTDSQCKFRTRLPTLRSAEQARADDLLWGATRVLSWRTSCRSEHGKQSGDGKQLEHHAARTCFGNLLRESGKAPSKRGRISKLL